MKKAMIPKHKVDHIQYKKDVCKGGKKENGT